jgi:putative ABC transport system permease protein
MFSVSRATVRERWALFIGAVLSVALGVALVQSSLLLLLTAATTPPPAGASAIDVTAHAADTTVAVTVLAVTLAFAAFLAFFIIGTTFAFTVDQRVRELALLRLVGASRRQVRRLLVSEGALLGAVGTVVGMPLGVGVMVVHAELLVRLGFVDPGFSGAWQWWIPGVSVGTGVGLAVSGVLLAARRAAAIAPLAALRDGESSGRVMTAGRWVTAALAGGGAVALLGLSPVGGPAAGQAMAMNVSIAAAVAVTAAAPLLVPLAARLLPVRRSAVIPLLARSSLRDNVRRSASTAAPLVILIGILVSQSTALLSFSASAAEQQRAAIEADLVVESVVGEGPGSSLDDIGALAGVSAVSTEVAVPAAVTTGEGEMAFTELGSVTVVDPSGYAAIHPGEVPFDGLDGAAAVAGPGSIGLGVGDSAGVRIGDVDLGRLPIVAEARGSMGAGPTLYLPDDLVSAALLDGAPAVSFVSVDRGATVADVAASLEAAGRVVPLDGWLERNADSGSRTAASILVVVLGLGALYALLGVVNSVVIASATRRHEFAVARASGLTRRQVVRFALLESSVVTTIGVALGLLSAAGTVIATALVTGAVAGTPTVVVPWVLVGAVVVGAFLVTGVTSVATSRVATSPAPVSLLRSRE